MDFNKGIDQLEAYRQQLLNKLDPSQRKMVEDSIKVMSTATTQEELQELEQQELKKIKDVYSDSSKGN
tara:strand:- start:3331 stop:3534 length:204 start_codon:yes stop_codon:yes gene_type:complete